MQPKLARIPADGDTRAEQIIHRARAAVTSQLLEALTDRDLLALGRYGARQPTLALRQGSPALLRDALLATAISQLGRPRGPRDLMTGLAIHHLVAQQIGHDPATLFDEVATHLPHGSVATLLRDFGTRHDITPRHSDGSSPKARGTRLHTSICQGTGASETLVVEPLRSYVICCVQRTGSWLLAHTLADTG